MKPTQEQLAAATNLAVGTHGNKFEVQGDVMGPNGFARTVRVAVRETLAEAQAYITDAQVHGMDSTMGDFEDSALAQALTTGARP